MKAREISSLLKPLVISGIYKDEEIALKNIIIDFIKNKEDFYRQTINKFEKQFNLNFDLFNEKIRNSASSKEEEIWMDWKAAVEMEKAWKDAMKNLIKK
jgi:hypothetical protein